MLSSASLDPDGEIQRRRSDLFVGEKEEGGGIGENSGLAIVRSEGKKKKE